MQLIVPLVQLFFIYTCFLVFPIPDPVPSLQSGSCFYLLELSLYNENRHNLPIHVAYLYNLVFLLTSKIFIERLKEVQILKQFLQLSLENIAPLTVLSQQTQTCTYKPSVNHAKIEAIPPTLAVLRHLLCKTPDCVCVTLLWRTFDHLTPAGILVKLCGTCHYQPLVATNNVCNQRINDATIIRMSTSQIYIQGSMTMTATLTYPHGIKLPHKHYLVPHFKCLQVT